MSVLSQRDFLFPLNVTPAGVHLRNRRRCEKTTRISREGPNPLLLESDMSDDPARWQRRPAIPEAFSPRQFAPSQPRDI
jgi:hypothetical protein